LDAVPTSIHCSLFIGDDLVVKDNSETPEQVDKTKQSFRNFLPILSPTTERVVSGTCWEEDDLMAELMESSYSKFIRPVIYNAEPIWPERYNREQIDKIREEVGSKVFSSQYLLSPVPEGAKVFTEQIIKYGRPLGNYLRFIYLDTAGSGKDFTGLISVLFADDSNKYVETAEGYHLPPTQVMDRALLLAERGCAGIAIEINFPIITANTLNAEQIRRYGKIRFPVFEVRHNTNKNARVGALQVPYANSKLLHFKELKGGHLEVELLRFPSGHPDLSDALAMCMEYGWFPNTIPTAAQAEVGSNKVPTRYAERRRF
jgi:hypothetical protein